MDGGVLCMASCVDCRVDAILEEDLTIQEDGRLTAWILASLSVGSEAYAHCQCMDA